MRKFRTGQSPERPLFEHPLIVVLGPTASGKSELAIRIAQEFSGEIVSFDSVQVYRCFDIGTAKLPLSQRGGVPHHLIDMVKPGRLFTAGDYARAARSALREIAARNCIPVLVGGTGFYLRALLEGLSPGPVRDDMLRARLLTREEKRHGSLHRILSRLDAQAAARIHSNDTNKIVRALELCLTRRQPASALFAQGKDALTGFRTVKIGLNPPRPALHERIDLRVTQMFESGLVEEVQSILASGVPRSAKPFESLGYSQALANLDGTLTLEQAIGSAQQATRQYAKRQMTWFRREAGVHWLPGFGTDAAVQADALALLCDFTRELKSNA